MYVYVSSPVNFEDTNRFLRTNFRQLSIDSYYDNVYPKEVFWLRLDIFVPRC